MDTFDGFSGTGNGDDGLWYPGKKEKQVGNGSLKLPLYAGRYYEVWGGPYVQSPTTHKGVSLKEDSFGPKAAVRIPIKDFSVPTQVDMRKGLIKVMRMILAGHPVYVGCGAGWGRTGMVLACLAKMFGVDNPVQYVRETYTSRAVETKDQEEFVKNFNPGKMLESMVWAARTSSLFRFGRKNLTNVPD